MHAKVTLPLKARAREMDMSFVNLYNTKLPVPYLVNCFKVEFFFLPPGFLSYTG